MTTLRQQLTQLRLGCHDTLSAFAPYRMAHGGYWVRHTYAGWYTVDRHRYEAYHGGSVTGPIIDMEDNSDTYQVLGTRICTGILAGSLALIAVLLA